MFFTAFGIKLIQFIPLFIAGIVGIVRTGNLYYSSVRIQAAADFLGQLFSKRSFSAGEFFLAVNFLPFSAGFAGFIHILAIDDFSVFGYKIAATTRAFPKRIAIGFPAINIIVSIAA